MSEILGNIYERSVAIVFRTVSFSIFGDCGNWFFDKEFFKILY